MKRAIYALGVLLLFCSGLKGSIPQKEIVVENDVEMYRILPAGKEAMVMFYKTDGAGRRNKRWHFSMYDTLLENKWNKELTLDRDFSFEQSEISENSILHVLMTNSRHSEYLYITLNLLTKQLDYFSGTIPTRATTSYFELVGEHAIFGGNADPTAAQNGIACCVGYSCIGIFLYNPFRDHATLNYVDYKNKKSKPIDFNFKGQTTLDNISVNEKDASFMAIVEVIKSTSQSQLHLLHFNENGEEQSHIHLKSGSEEVTLMDGFIHGDKESQYIVGSYAPRASSQKAQGLYFTTVQNGIQNDTRCYELSDFREFWKNYGEENEWITEKWDKIGERIGLRGKEFKILPNRIERRGDQVIYIGEAYYPTYSTERYYDWDTETWRTRSVFNGYYYAYGIVAGFSSSGVLLWQDSYPLLYKSFVLSPRARVLTDPKNSNLLLVYKTQDVIRTELIGEDRLEPKETSSIVAANEYNEAFNADNLSFEYWYDNYFLSSGYRVVVDRNKRNGSRIQTIFYFSKIEY